MAYVKKADRENSENENIKVAEIQEKVKTETLEDMIKKQNEIIESQRKALEELLSKKMATAVTENVSNDSTIILELLKTLKALKNNSQRDIVKVIHLYDNAQSMFKLSNGNMITFTYYGQVQPMSIVDAELLLNQHKDTFEKGGLTFDSEHLYMLKERGIDTSKINYKPLESIEKVNEMSETELKDLVINFQPFQREMLKSHILNKLVEDKEYISMDTLRFLNKLQKNIYKSKEGGYEFIMDKLTKLGVED